MVQILLSDRATASGVSVAPSTLAAARRERRPRGSSGRQRSRCEVRLGSLNVGTMSGKGVEVVEMMERRRLEVLCIQETKWKGDRARTMMGGYKLLHAGGDGRINRAGIIVSEETSKTVVSVERWKGRVVMAWLMIRKQMMCVMLVYGPHTGRTKAEKEEFRDALERMIGLVELEVMLCIAGDFNAHVGVVEPGEEESVGRYGWGARNREGRALVELVARNGLAVASSFFQKRESHKITCRSGQHKTELNLVIVRKQQLWKIKDCKAVAGEHVTTQHQPVVFVVCMQNKKQTKNVGRRTIKWSRCKDDVAVEYKERVTVKYEELSEEVGGLEEEWKKYKEAFVGAAEELCGRTSGKGGMSRSSNQGWWTSEVAEAVCEKKEAWKEIEKTKEKGNEPDARMIHTYGQKKRAAKRAVDKARRDMEADVYSKLDEDGGKKMIYKMARDRDENSKDVKGGTVMKDRNGKLVTEQEAVLKVWESYFKALLNQERNNNDLELPSYVEGKVELSDITDT